jgi:peptidoglycan/xylan/chitin deacetylase (PgdA/CDA1 family)
MEISNTGKLTSEIPVHTSDLKVLMYHHIVNDRRVARDHWSCVHVDRFRKHLEWLERCGFTTITLDDYRLAMNGSLTLPKKPIILTFDDGYHNVYRYAFPVLQEFGMKAVVFVLGDRNRKTNDWRYEEPVTPLLEGRQILEMHLAGFEIGSHSLTHSKLTEVSPEETWNEIYYSRMILESLLNAPVRSFSYPYGLLNNPIKKMVADAGYLTGCGVYTGPPDFYTDQYDIRRITIYNRTGVMGMLLRTCTPYQHFDWIKMKTKQRLRPDGK